MLILLTLFPHFIFYVLLLQFFMLILLIFLAELAAAILAFIFREHVSLNYSHPHFDQSGCIYCVLCSTIGLFTVML